VHYKTKSIESVEINASYLDRQTPVNLFKPSSVYSKYQSRVRGSPPV